LSTELTVAKQYFFIALLLLYSGWVIGPTISTNYEFINSNRPIVIFDHHGRELALFFIVVVFMLKVVFIRDALFEGCVGVGVPIISHPHPPRMSVSFAELCKNK